MVRLGADTNTVLAAHGVGVIPSTRYQQFGSRLYCRKSWMLEANRD